MPTLVWLNSSIRASVCTNVGVVDLTTLDNNTHESEGTSPLGGILGVLIVNT